MIFEIIDENIEKVEKYFSFYFLDFLTFVLADAIFSSVNNDAAPSVDTFLANKFDANSIFCLQLIYLLS